MKKNRLIWTASVTCLLWVTGCGAVSEYTARAVREAGKEVIDRTVENVVEDIAGDLLELPAIDLEMDQALADLADDGADANEGE